MLFLLSLEACEVGECLFEACVHVGGEGPLTADHELAHGIDRGGELLLEGSGVDGLAAVGEFAGLQSRAGGEVWEGFEVPLAQLEDSDAPFDEKGLTLPVRDQAQENEGQFAIGDLRQADDRSPMAAEGSEHALGEPFHDGVLRPEVMESGPCFFVAAGLAGALDGFCHGFAVRGQRVAMVPGAGFGRHGKPEALLEVARRGEADGAFGFIERELGNGLRAGELFEGSPRKEEVAMGTVITEERRRFCDERSGRRRGFLWTF